MNKKCPQCQEEKPLTNEFFHSSKQSKTGFRSWCKPCVIASNTFYNRLRPAGHVARVLKSRNRCEESKQSHVATQDRYRKRNPEKYRDTRAAKKYGVPQGWYTQKLKETNGQCEICGVSQVEQNKYLAVDHCHGTGLVRGLLCSKCNLGLGQFRHDPKLLSAAAEYLNKHG